MIRLARQPFGPEDAAALAAVLDSGHVLQGPRVAAFEAALAERLSVPHVVAVSSGTAALHLALLALPVRRGTPVVLPAYTFPATLNAVLHAGLRPVPVDIDPRTFNIDELAAERVLRGLSEPAIFLPVHEFGLPAPLSALAACLAEGGHRCVEDAACAIGSSSDLGGRSVLAGTWGEVGCFSFHPRKVLTTAEGGALAVADAALADRLRMLRNHGMVRRPGEPVTVFEAAGLNYRLSDLHAALGLRQLQTLDALLAERQRIARLYLDRLASDEAGLSGRIPGLVVPYVPPGMRPNWQSFVVRIRAGIDRDTAIHRLADWGVEAAAGAHSLPLQPAYRRLPGFTAPFPGAADAFFRAIALPMPHGLSESEADRVVEALARLHEAA